MQIRLLFTARWGLGNTSYPRMKGSGENKGMGWEREVEGGLHAHTEIVIERSHSLQELRREFSWEILLVDWNRRKLVVERGG